MPGRLRRRVPGTQRSRSCGGLPGAQLQLSMRTKSPTGLGSSSLATSVPIRSARHTPEGVLASAPARTRMEIDRTGRRRSGGRSRARAAAEESCRAARVRDSSRRSQPSWTARAVPSARPTRSARWLKIPHSSSARARLDEASQRRIFLAEHGEGGGIPAAPGSRAGRRRPWHSTRGRRGPGKFCSVTASTFWSASGCLRHRRSGSAERLETGLASSLPGARSTADGIELRVAVGQRGRRVPGRGRTLGRRADGSRWIAGGSAEVEDELSSEPPRASSAMGVPPSTSRAIPRRGLAELPGAQLFHLHDRSDGLDPGTHLVALRPGQPDREPDRPTPAFQLVAETGRRPSRSGPEPGDSAAPPPHGGRRSVPPPQGNGRDERPGDTVLLLKIPAGLDEEFLQAGRSPGGTNDRSAGLSRDLEPRGALDATPTPPSPRARQALPATTFQGSWLPCAPLPGRAERGGSTTRSIRPTRARAAIAMMVLLLMVAMEFLRGSGRARPPSGGDVRHDARPAPRADRSRTRS